MQNTIVYISIIKSPIDEIVIQLKNMYGFCNSLIS